MGHDVYGYQNLTSLTITHRFESIRKIGKVSGKLVKSQKKWSSLSKTYSTLRKKKFVKLGENKVM